MKALCLMPFAFAAGAEGFALFAPYLVIVLSVLYVARSARPSRMGMPAFRLPRRPRLGVLPDAQPAM
jgi:hypothetical protein